MKTIRTFMACVGAMLAFACPAFAQLRTSASYAIGTEAKDAGGRRATSISYTNHGSAGGVAGVSSVGAPAETAKHGFIAQLYEITGLTLTAATLNVNETATDQLGATFSLDDATFTAAPAANVAWSVQSGPIAGINAGGVATAGNVYQNTAATVQGISAGQTGSLGLTVLNVGFDDFGSYAGDGLGDDWQVQYFGQANPNAAPLLDPDGDGQTNRFEFIAGLVPIDPASRFVLSIAAVPGQPGQKNLIFSPRFIDRTYAVKAKANLADATWGAINASAPSDNGQTRTITDLSAAGPTKYYHVEITKP